jgi:hypothetical protein
LPEPTVRSTPEAAAAVLAPSCIATKNGFVESLVISETATAPPAGASDAAAAEEAGAAAEEAGAAAEDSLDEEPELHAARVTATTPVTATAATRRPRDLRFVMVFPSKGGWV